MKKVFLLGLKILIGSIFFTAGVPANLFSEGAKAMPTVQTVKFVDLQRYLGTWYEISKYPQRFERNCFGVTANYSLRKDGLIKVVNACRKGSLNGPEKLAVGKAWIVNKVTNSQLKVQFFWPFAGEYWIIDLGANYEYAVVGSSNRKYLWVLSRTPQLEEKTYAAILQRIEQQGYDLSKIELIPQPAAK